MSSLGSGGLAGNEEGVVGLYLHRCCLCDSRAVSIDGLRDTSSVPICRPA